MNKNAMFDDLLLGYLFNKGKVSTLKTEGLFGSENDTQAVNNLVCNRKNKTSYLNKGYIAYDSEKHEVSITDAGKAFMNERYKGHRK